LHPSGKKTFAVPLGLTIKRSPGLTTVVSLILTNPCPGRLRERSPETGSTVVAKHAVLDKMHSPPARAKAVPLRMPLQPHCARSRTHNLPDCIVIYSGGATTYERYPPLYRRFGDLCAFWTTHPGGSKNSENPKNPKDDPIKSTICPGRRRLLTCHAMGEPSPKRRAADFTGVALLEHRIAGKRERRRSRATDGAGGRP